jgi:hypothetical protein
MGVGPLQDVCVPARTGSVRHADVPTEERGVPQQLQDGTATWRMLPALC